MIRFVISVGTAVFVVACSGKASIDYSRADPVGDARRSLLDSGHFHILVVRVGDSLIAPSDTAVLHGRSYNVATGPEWPMVYLPLDPSADHKDRPSAAQLRYVTAYNTTLFALLDSNAAAVKRRVDARARRN